MGKILLIVGILGMLLGGLAAVVSLMLPQFTRNVKMDEALIGVIAGAVVLAISLLPAAIGIVLLLVRRKGAAA